MTADLSTARSDGPIANAQAESWWRHSLTDFDQARTSIAAAAAADQTDLQNGRARR
jgi:hypothetical protein